MDHRRSDLLARRGLGLSHYIVPACLLLLDFRWFWSFISVPGVCVLQRIPVLHIIYPKLFGLKGIDTPVYTSVYTLKSCYADRTTFLRLSHTIIHK